jgi:hypothetical protein
VLFSVPAVAQKKRLLLLQRQLWQQNLTPKDVIDNYLKHQAERKLEAIKSIIIENTLLSVQEWKLNRLQRN